MTKTEAYQRSFRAALATRDPVHERRVDQLTMDRGLRVNAALRIEREEWARAQMRGAPIPAWPGF
jgi:hypothetical protein